MRKWQEAYDEVLQEYHAHQKGETPPPKQTSAGVYIMLDDEGYSLFKSDADYFRKRNKIVGVDKYKYVYWVEARTSYDIRPGAGWDLPASRFMVKKGLWVVDFGQRSDYDQIKHFKMYKAKGVIVPRKERLLTDIMLGWKHIFVILDKYDKQADTDREEEIRKWNQTDGYDGISWY